MNNLPLQQHIKFITVEQPTAWLVVAVLVETRDGETVIVSEPKVVKVVPKEQKLKLKGETIASEFVLAGSDTPEIRISSSVVSPYITSIFGYANTDLIVGLAARPPTK